MAFLFFSEKTLILNFQHQPQYCLYQAFGLSSLMKNIILPDVCVCVRDFFENETKLKVLRVEELLLASFQKQLRDITTNYYVPTICTYLLIVVSIVTQTWLGLNLSMLIYAYKIVYQRTLIYWINITGLKSGV